MHIIRSLPYGEPFVFYGGHWLSGTSGATRSSRTPAGVFPGPAVREPLLDGMKLGRIVGPLHSVCPPHPLPFQSPTHLSTSGVPVRNVLNYETPQPPSEKYFLPADRSDFFRKPHAGTCKHHHFWPPLRFVCCTNPHIPSPRGVQYPHLVIY